MPTQPRLTQFSAFAAAFTLLSTAAFATPSGLDNIPTANTTPQGTLVLIGLMP